MAEENVSQDFRSKKLDKARNYFIEEIKQNELISQKHKKVYKILIYTEDLLIVASTVTGCISALTSSVGIPVGIASSAITIKNSVITTGIKNLKSIINKKIKET